jgi:hypothetical protein
VISRRDVNAWLRRMVLVLCLVPLGLFVSGCEDDDDFEDHNVPEGQGSMGIDNRTADDLLVYADGSRIARVTDGNNAIVDMAPHTYRIVIENEDGRGSWSHSVDVLQGEVTVLRVYTAVGRHDYNVDIDYE